LSGQLISENFLRRLAAKGPLFTKMPSSCKDIRKCSLHVLAKRFLRFYQERRSHNVYKNQIA
jgi:hypothetical protein